MAGAEASSVTPGARRSCCSLLTGGFMGPTVRAALRGQPIPPLRDTSLNADAAFAALSKHWAQEAAVAGSGGTPSLLRALWRAFGRDFLLAGALKLVWGALLVVCGAYFTRALLAYIRFRATDPVHTSEEAAGGVVLAVAFFVAAFLLTLSMQQMTRISARLGLRVRAAVSTAVYRKALVEDRNLPGGGGDVLSLVSTDSTKLGEAALTIHYLWGGAVEALAIIGVLIGFTGKAALVGLGLVLALIPLQFGLGRCIASMRKRTVAASEARVGVMAEILTAIKLVKMYAWQAQFQDAVQKLRAKEVSLSRIGGVLKTLNYALVFVIPPLTALSIFGVYVADQRLDAVLAFTTLSLFNSLRVPLVALPKGLRAAADASAALVRLEEYLLAPERESAPALQLGPPPAPAPVPLDAGAVVLVEDRGAAPGAAGSAEAGEIILQDASFGCGRGASPILRHLTLHAPRGSFVIVAGSVASGKSVLMRSMLGQFTLLEGRCDVRGRFAYVPQTPWCAQGTVRSNITFGSAFQPARYDRVVHACALRPDFALLEAGDETTLGERGSNTSGGQRQRIALARAAYSHADTYFLDSVLSAVDAYTSAHIVRHCIRGVMLAEGSTVVLATHQAELFPLADILVVMEGGAFAYAGPPAPEVIRRYFPNASALGGAEADAAVLDALHVTDHAAPATPGGTAGAASGAPAPGGGGGGGSDRAPEPILEEGGPEDAPPTHAVAVSEGALSAAGPLTERAMSLRAGILATAQAAAEAAVDLEHGEEDAAAAAVSKVVDAVRRTRAESLAVGLHSQSTSRGSALALSPIRAPAGSFAIAAGKAPTPAAASAEIVVEVPPPPATALPHGPVSRPRVEEVRVSGYGALLKELRVHLVILAVAVFVGAQVTRIYSDIWISTWVGGRFPDRSQEWHVGIYGGYVAVFLAFLLLRGLFFYTMSTSAASRMHSSAFEAVLRAPFAFFTVTPLGKLLSVFGVDQDAVDEALQDSLKMTLIYFMILGTTVGVVIKTIPPFAGIAGALALAFAYYFRQYIKASRRLKDSASAATGDLLTHVSETLQGLPVIQAFAAEARFASHNLQLVDHASDALSTLDGLQLWLSFRLDGISALLLLGTCLLAVLLDDRLTTSAAGLAVSNSFQILLWSALMVKSAADVDSNISAVERIVRLGGVEPEKDVPLSHDTCPPDSWPAHGEIDFTTVSAAYLPAAPHVLKGVSFSVHRGEKIGVVGRTGAGKSSLIMALYRLTATLEGDIRVDGIPTRGLNLGELRRRMAIIPQEPFMFKGTLRTNLDPFGEHSDATLISALEACQLGELLRSDPAGLGRPVSHMGSNFSLGQQQLLCLARALLNPSALLLLDEATAALDSDTDALVQRLLRSPAFAQRTIITIAHRLETIIDSDRVLVLDSGRVAEFASPHELLSHPESIFSALCRQTGAQYEALREAASRHAAAVAALQAKLVEGDREAERREAAELAAQEGRRLRALSMRLRESHTTESGTGNPIAVARPPHHHASGGDLGGLTLSPDTSVSA